MSKKINLNINFSQNDGNKQIFYTDYNLMADVPETADQEITIHSESSFKGSIKELKNTFMYVEKYIYSFIRNETYESMQEKIENIMKSQTNDNENNN